MYRIIQNGIIYVFYFALLVLGVFAKDGPTVQVEQGLLQGTYLTTINERTISAFQGIPYAEPPTGILRFKEPALPKPWTGIWNATLPGSACFQYQRLFSTADKKADPIIGEEDCLYINIYTPKIPDEYSSLNFDVIFYIHGGAFMYGSGHLFGPRLLLDKDVVFVTFNYRLGPLGFLSTEDGVIPGNMGMKDQVAALKWVHRNIAAFGGNPESITLVGNSAGGASVHYHYISPLSRGLFKRGYSQSGSALCPWTLMEGGRSKAEMLGQSLGCKTGSSEELKNCLLTRPARQIVQQVESFLVWRYNPFAPFGPTVEKGSSMPFLDKPPTDAILNGDLENVPWMTSVTTEEGLYPSADWLVDENVMIELDTRFSELLPHILDYNYTVPENQKQNIVNLIKQHYLQNNPVTKKVTRGIIKMISDRIFILEVARAAKLQASVNSAPVYFYKFGYRGKYSLSDHLSGTNINFGVCHADDVGYTTDCFIANPGETETDKEMTHLLVDIWSNFAQSGNPNPSSKSVIWEPIPCNSKEIKYLYIQSPNQLEMQADDKLGEQDFWDSLPIQEPQIGKNVPDSTKHTEF